MTGSWSPEASTFFSRFPRGVCKPNLRFLCSGSVIGGEYCVLRRSSINGRLFYGCTFVGELVNKLCRNSR